MNDPRRNAREDLASLINVNVIFLGFMREVNQIDATFKHAYIEDPQFSAKDLAETVDRLESAVARTLAASDAHLMVSKRITPKRGEKESSDGAPEPAAAPLTT